MKILSHFRAIWPNFSPLKMQQIIWIIWIIGSELFGIRFDKFTLANNIRVFDSVQYLVFVQTLDSSISTKFVWSPSCEQYWMLIRLLENGTEDTQEPPLCTNTSDLSSSFVLCQVDLSVLTLLTNQLNIGGNLLTCWEWKMWIFQFFPWSYPILCKTWLYFAVFFLPLHKHK